jgi:outer membrane protein TolC
MNKKQTYNLARTLTLGPLFCLAACTVGPDFTPPDLSSVMQDEWQLEAGETDRFSQIRQPESAWWRQFSDAELASLIGRLHESSLPLAKARERIVEVNARQGVIEPMSIPAMTSFPARLFHPVRTSTSIPPV